MEPSHVFCAELGHIRVCRQGAGHHRDGCLWRRDPPGEPVPLQDSRRDAGPSQAQEPTGRLRAALQGDGPLAREKALDRRRRLEPSLIYSSRDPSASGPHRVLHLGHINDKSFSWRSNLCAALHLWQNC